MQKELRWLQNQRPATYLLMPSLTTFQFSTGTQANTVPGSKRGQGRRPPEPLMCVGLRIRGSRSGQSCSVEMRREARVLV